MSKNVKKKNLLGWYPGHMRKAEADILENIQIANVILEVVDARAPLTTKSSFIEKFKGSKRRIFIINKCDLISSEDKKAIENYFTEKKELFVTASTREAFGIRRLLNLLNKAYDEKKEKMAKKGMVALSAKVLVVGMPNVGKSTIINKLVNRKIVGVAKTPGFTRGKKWIKLLDNVELLDTPGILYPNMSSEEAIMKLAVLGCIKDLPARVEQIALKILEHAAKNNELESLKKYKLKTEDIKAGIDGDILGKIALNLNMLFKEGEPNIQKAVSMIINDYREGRIGKFMLDNINININDKGPV